MFYKTLYIVKNKYFCSKTIKKFKVQLDSTLQPSGIILKYLE